MDWVLFLVVGFLSSFGLVEIYSIALGQEELDLLNFKKQVFFIILGIILMFIFARIDYFFLKSISKYLYVVAVLLLVGVLMFGETIRGTTGWFDVAGFGIQPVEIVKIILVLFLASYVSSLSTSVKTVKHLIVSGGATLLLAGLVMWQPDFGSAFILLFVWFFVILFSGFKRKYIVSLLLLTVIAGLLSWNFLFESYQKERVRDFLQVETESIHRDYNMSQSIIAVGSGRIMGRGVGFGSQSQLKFLPEAQNDFIFAVIAEELGLLGVSLLICFFVIFFWRIILAIRKLNNDFAIFTLVGALGLIFIQMFINIGMNIGLVPIVGISLPFVSYGGSSIISNFILLGIIQNVIIQTKANY